MDLFRRREGCDNRFTYLLIALVILLLGYPYWGRFVGGLVTLGILVPGVYAVHSRGRVFRTACAIAVVTAALSIVTMIRGRTGNPLVEASFFLFFAFLAVSVFVEVMRSRDVMSDTLSGAVSVYLLVGIVFGQLYDLLETLRPGSFHAVGTVEGQTLGWAELIYYSFMTLTTIGYGDITPATDGARSLAILEGSIGVLFVAILIARLVAPTASRTN